MLPSTLLPGTGGGRSQCVKAKGEGETFMVSKEHSSALDAESTIKLSETQHEMRAAGLTMPKKTKNAGEQTAAEIDSYNA